MKRFLPILILMSLASTQEFADSQTDVKVQEQSRMAWWQEARFGMFIHWGLFSIPAGE
jgi:alpha-L-fucosidase